MKKVQSADGTTIAYDQMGNGPAVILVDGALGYRAFGFMAPLATQLSPHFTVINYDRRGNGRSPAPNDWKMTSPEEQADGAAALLTALRNGAK